MTDKNLRNAFDLFDLDNNGEITPRELKHVLQNEEQSLADSLWENLIDEFDQNNDGQINFEEFKKMMMKLNMSPASAK